MKSFYILSMPSFNKNFFLLSIPFILFLKQVNKVHLNQLQLSWVIRDLIKHNKAIIFPLKVQNFLKNPKTMRE